MRRRAAPPPHAYPTYPEERKAAPPIVSTPYVPLSSRAAASSPSYPRSYLPNHPSSGGTGGGQSYSGGDVRKDFVQTATLHGKWALRGLKDACRVRKGVDLVLNDARLRGNLVKSLLINIPFLLFLLFLSFVLLPLITKSPSARNPNPSALSYFLRSPNLWNFIGTGGVVLVNGIWQGKIAERAWGLNGGGGGGGGAGAMGVNGGAAAGGSLSSRALILLDFVVVTSTFRLIPYLGWIPAFAYTLLVNAFYVFEYTQSAQGYTLPERVLFLQTRSSYFAGFALPLTLLTTNPFLPPLLSTTIFALLYPLYLILSSSSQPLPSAGSSSAFSSLPVSASGGEDGGGAGGGEEGEGGGHEGEWWEWWPRKVRVLEGGLWAVEVWEGLAAGSRMGHRRKGSRL